MATAAKSDVPSPQDEQRMVIYNVPWRDYVILREALDTPGLRMTYCEGMLELMTPSLTHELNKKSVARLVELYAVLRRLPMIGYGSTMFRREAKQRGAEPDECYRLGKQMKEGEFPDIVLEVIHTNPIVDKLDVYRGFEIPEVWLFRDEAFEVYRVVDGAYARIERSRLLPDLDLGLIARLAARADQDEALQELRAILG
jgi:Uma2 family endonuclease